MKNKIIELLKRFNNKSFKIVTSIEIFVEVGDISFKSWSNEKQKYEIYSLDTVPEEYITEYLLSSLIDIINFNKKINDLNIYTEDFITFNLKNTNISFKDTNYYLIPDAISGIIKIHEAILNNDIEKFLSLEKIFKKTCEIKKMTIFDYYFIVTKKETNFFNKMFYFKDYYNKKYNFIKELEEVYNINIIIKDKKLYLNLPNTDVIKSFPEKNLNHDNVITLILDFLKNINKNDKLLKYIEIYKKLNLKNCYIAKSYGFGVFYFYNFSFEEDIKDISNKLKKENISFKNEYSDKNFIYRFKINIK